MKADESGLRCNAMVDRLVAAGAVTSGAVERAMRTVPRHRLLRDVWLSAPDDPLDLSRVEHHRIEEGSTDPAILARVYEDIAIPTRMAGGVPTSSTSQPSLVAQMLELLGIQAGMRVLEIGAGTGYNAALLAEVVGDQGQVHTVDIDAEVVEQTARLLAESGYGDIAVTCGDGAAGFAPAAPYDRIVATVGCPDVAPDWLDQLAPGGFVLVPLLHAGVHPLTTVVPAPPAAHGRVVGCSGFMPMQGALGHELQWPKSWPKGRHLGERRLALTDELAAAGGDESWPGWDFHYYLGIVDHRAVPVGLTDQRGALNLDFGARELVEAGDADHLRRDLNGHLRAWQRLGRPRAQDWRSTFVPLSDDADRLSANAIERVCHVQLVTLDTIPS